MKEKKKDKPPTPKTYTDKEVRGEKSNEPSKIKEKDGWK